MRRSWSPYSATARSFAASLTDSDTGYALTASQLSEAATLGVVGQGAVDTQDCAS